MRTDAPAICFCGMLLREMTGESGAEHACGRLQSDQRCNACIDRQYNSFRSRKILLFKLTKIRFYSKNCLTNQERSDTMLTVSEA